MRARDSTLPSSAFRARPLHCERSLPHTDGFSRRAAAYLESNCRNLESNCRNLVVAPSKLQRVIKAQQVMVGKLHAVDETSVEYRIEAQVLQRLLDAREKLIKPEAA